MKTTTKNIISGVGTVLTIMPAGPVIADIKPFYAPKETLQEALKGDWQKIGQDLKIAISKHSAKAGD